MSLFEAAMGEMKSEILDDLERRMWERLEPRIQQDYGPGICQSLAHLNIFTFLSKPFGG